MPRGFIDCTNPGYNLVSLDVGDLESRFAIGSRAAPSVQQFEVWDPAARKLEPGAGRAQGRLASRGLHEAGARGSRHPRSEASKKPVRYLQPEHGTVVWGVLDESGHPTGPMLVTPKKKIPLALTINDISHDVRWLPFRKAYQLAPGVHDRLLDPPRNQPLITMDLDGRITRHAIPAGLTRQLDALGAPAPAEMTATRAGDLVFQRACRPTAAACTWCRANRAGASGARRSPRPARPAAATAARPRSRWRCRPTAAASRSTPALRAPANGFPDAPTVKVLTLCGGSAAPRPRRRPARKKLR